MKIQSKQANIHSSRPKANNAGSEESEKSISDTFEKVGSAVTDVIWNTVGRAALYTIAAPIAVVKGVGGMAFCTLRGMGTQHSKDPLVDAALTVPMMVAFAGLHGAGSALAVMRGAEGIVQLVNRFDEHRLSKMRFPR